MSDKESPKKRGMVGRFLLTEGELSLKLVFDNVRNYLICATFLALYIWLLRMAPAESSLLASRFPWLSARELGLLAAAIGLVLVSLNFAQSLLLVGHVLESSLDLLDPAVSFVKNHPSKLITAAGMALLMLAGLVVALLFSAVFSLVMSVVIQLMTFSGAGARAL